MEPPELFEVPSLLFVPEFGEGEMLFGEHGMRYLDCVALETQVFPGLMHWNVAKHSTVSLNSLFGILLQSQRMSPPES
jgi:hypothetical protein